MCGLAESEVKARRRCCRGGSPQLRAWRAAAGWACAPAPAHAQGRPGVGQVGLRQVPAGQRRVGEHERMVRRMQAGGCLPGELKAQAACIHAAARPGACRPPPAPAHHLEAGSRLGAQPGYTPPRFSLSSWPTYMPRIQGEWKCCAGWPSNVPAARAGQQARRRCQQAPGAPAVCSPPVCCATQPAAHMHRWRSGCLLPAACAHLSRRAAPPRRS